MSEQGLQEGAKHAPFWGPSVEDQRGGDVVSYLHHLEVACQEVHDPITQGGVETQGLKLNNKQHSYVGISHVQMGLCSVMAIASSVDLLGWVAN